MAQDQWIEATEKLRAAQQTRTRGGRRTNRNKVIAQEGQRLSDFLNSDEGKAALQLLKSTRRSIRFGEESNDGGFGRVFFINGSGLHESYEAMGTWMAYVREVPKPIISSITPEEAIRAASTYQRLRPDKVLSWLEQELDKIADSVLRK